MAGSVAPAGPGIAGPETAGKTGPATVEPGKSGSETAGLGKTGSVAARPGRLAVYTRPVQLSTRQAPLAQPANALKVPAAVELGA